MPARDSASATTGVLPAGVGDSGGARNRSSERGAGLGVASLGFEHARARSASARRRGEHHRLRGHPPRHRPVPPRKRWLVDSSAGNGARLRHRLRCVQLPRPPLGTRSPPALLAHRAPASCALRGPRSSRRPARGRSRHGPRSARHILRTSAHGNFRRPPTERFPWAPSTCSRRGRRTASAPTEFASAADAPRSTAYPASTSWRPWRRGEERVARWPTVCRPGRTGRHAMSMSPRDPALFAGS